MSALARSCLLIAAFIIASTLVLVEPIGATGGGGGGGGGEGEFSSRSKSKSTKPKSKAKSKAKPASKSNSKKARAKAPRAAVAPAKSVNAAVSRANKSTDRCVRFNKTFGSRRKCMIRMMTQFGKDLKANKKELPVKTPANADTVIKAAKAMAKAKTKQATVSAIEQARSAFAVSMELAGQEDPDGEKQYASKMDKIKGALENAYEALEAAG